MDSSDEPDVTGVMVIEPMGNAAPFLVKAAARLGIRLYAATEERVHAHYEPWLTHSLAGVCRTELADTARALDDMEAYCRAHRIAGVTVCWELLTPLAAMLAARLGLPGNDPLRARAARNKIAMAEAFRAAGVPAPANAVVATAEQAHEVAASGRLGWPLVVKPAEQGGSWGVSVVAGPDGLDTAVTAAGRFTRAEPHGLPLDSRVLLQSYVAGEEFSADTVVHDGVPYPLPVVRKDTTAGRYRVETGHSCPAGLDPRTVRAIQDTAARAALAVGVRNGIAHTEVKVPPRGEPVVIETGARLPGDDICEIVEAATGISEAAAYLRVVTGQPPRIAPTRDAAAALRFLLPDRAGVVEEVVIPEVPGTHSRIDIRPGERVPEPADSSGRIGHVMAHAASVDEARRLAGQVIADSRVRVSSPMPDPVSGPVPGPVNDPVPGPVRNPSQNAAQNPAGNPVPDPAQDPAHHFVRKIAFLRSVEIRRADPYIQSCVRDLTRLGVESCLFHTHGTADDGEFPGERRRLDAAVTPAELAREVAEWGADAAVSISLPCENALRDATVKELLEARGIPTVMTPLASTLALCDKWEAKRLLLRAGLDTPRGVKVDSDLLAGRGVAFPAYADALRASAAGIGYPLLSKPLWDSTSMGIRALPDATALDLYLADPPEVSAVIEECVAGALCSVDIVGEPGKYRVLPVCWTGTAGTEPVFTFAGLRWCGPRPQADADFAPVAAKLIALCEELGVQGSVNVDMIYTGSRYVILEINPRIGGATTLSCAASGTNTFDALAGMARGDHAPVAVRRTGWAIEFLSPERVPESVRRAELTDRLNLVTTHELVIDDTSHGDIVVFTVAEGDEQQTVKQLEELHRTAAWPRQEILDKIRTLLTP